MDGEALDGVRGFNPSGYSHPLYAASLAEFGSPRELSGCGGWILERQIPGTQHLDAMGPYPLFICKVWEELPEDLDALKNELVSVMLVIGPFSTIPIQHFMQYFSVFYPYKDHYILDLSLPLEKTIAKGHRRNAQRALRNLEVEVVLSPHIYLDEWGKLYDSLIRRHNIRGIRTFSRESFRKQLAIPNIHYFRVLRKGVVVGGNLFIVQDDVAYAHLSAFSDEGYELGAPYAVKWYALQHLSKIARWVNLGGSTSSDAGAGGGLDYFKQGWSSKTEKSYFCGKILNKKIYDELVVKTNASASSWFPAYRLSIL